MLCGGYAGWEWGAWLGKPETWGGYIELFWGGYDGWAEWFGYPVGACDGYPGLFWGGYADGWEANPDEIKPAPNGADGWFG